MAIIGGGPAGTAAALTLLRYSKLRPVVIERTSYEGWRVGETVSPGVVPLLEYLGAAGVLVDQGQRRAYATSAAWGGADVLSRDFLFAGSGDAWHVDRARFDAALAELVVQRGGAVVRSNCAAAAPLDTRFVIDATGRHAVYARSRGARVHIDDHLTGLVAVFEGTTDSQTSTLVEAVDDGWWYSAHLPGNRTVVAFMTDADIIREGSIHERERWLERLRQTRATQQRIESAQLLHGPIAAPAHSQILDPVCGDGWIAAGDAAVSFDPLSSMGIGYAITSGIQAARVASSALGGNHDHARVYAADVAQHYRAYLARRQAYYLIEKRWPAAPFWSRRQTQKL